MNGVILYEGPSVLDGQPIVVVATMNSRNAKTGDMVQTWIMRADLDPVSASKSLLDGSVCGACPHRRSLGGACYVNLVQAPLAVYRAFKRGAYPKDLDDNQLSRLFAGRMVRLGSYGDPAAVPISLWDKVTKLSAGTTGYTHQIGHPNFDPRLLGLCMVSADTPKAAAMHHKHGRRTFRVKTPDSALLPNEIECLSDTVGKTCAECGLCAGANTDGPSVAINVHGTLAKRYVTKYGRINAINLTQ